MTVTAAACGIAGGSAAWLSPPLVLLLAWWWDHRFGEPPTAWHPVAWMGNVLRPLGAAAKRLPPAAAFVSGAVAWLVCAAALFVAAWSAQRFLVDRLGLFAALALAPLLKPMFAWRMLRDEVLAVQQAFGDEEEGGGAGLQRARSRLARLVSRDVGRLDDSGVREAAIETLAENLNDSVVAPLFWFALLGLPGAVVYRFANTADAMWGYRGEWEWAGKFAARADDVLSWVPARLAAGLLMGVASGPPSPTVRVGDSVFCVRHSGPRLPSPEYSPASVRGGREAPVQRTAVAQSPTVRAEPAAAHPAAVRAEPVEALSEDLQGFEELEYQGSFDKLRANGEGGRAEPAVAHPAAVRAEPVEALSEDLQGFEELECQGSFDELRANGEGGRAEPAAAHPAAVRAEPVEALSEDLESFEEPKRQGPFDKLRANGVGRQAEPIEATAPMPGSMHSHWRNLARLRPIARLTPSPNGGWPMGAMALRLGVRLGKPGVYLLNAGGAALTPVHLASAVALAGRAAAGALGLALLGALISGAAWQCVGWSGAWA